MQFRKDIQGLRALAFLLVFIFHIDSSYLPGGFIGVDLFFVISGFLITSILARSIAKNQFSFKEFYIKRFKRIAPAYFVLVLSVALVGTYILMQVDERNFRSTVIRTFLFISNLQFQKGESYFGVQLSENPLLHTWSLAIEMQFYLILPFLLFFFKKFRLAILVFLLVSLTAWSSYEIIGLDKKSIAYFSLYSRIPEFLVGSLYALFFKNGIDFKKWGNNAFACINLISLILCAIWINEQSPFPGYLSLIPCIFSANLLVAKNNFVSDLLSTKFLVYIGELSYSLYLWHWPIMAFIRYRNDNYEFSLVQIILISILTFFFSFLSYEFVEKKFRTMETKKFFGILTPIWLTGFVFSFFLIYPIMDKKKIPDFYAKPVFGIKSHYKGIVEKFGDQTKTSSIFLFGDSHALMLKPFLNYIGKKNDFSFYTLTSQGYPAIHGIKESEIPESKLGFYKQGQSLIERTDSMISTTDLLILNSRGFERFPSLETALENFILKLKPNQKLILINTFPELDGHPLRLYNRILKKGNPSLHFIQNPKNREILEKLDLKYPNVYLYDLTKSKVFADPGYVSDTVSYYDKAHLNTYGSIKLGEDLDEDFMQFLEENHLISQVD